MLLVNDNKQLTATVTPSNATNKNVTWTSSNEAVAIVTDDGTVMATNKAGSTTIIASAEGTSVQAVCTVKVANGRRITPRDISSLNLSAISGEYLLQLTGTWNSGELKSLGRGNYSNGSYTGKIYNANANAEIILDMSEVTGLTSIGDWAFQGCTGLTSVTIPDSVTSIGAYAFWDCTGLTSVTIPDSVRSIGGSAFSDCTGLTSVTIGNGVTSIGDEAFCDCTGLTSFIVDEANTTYKASDDEKMLLSKDGKTLVCYPSATGSVRIPDSVTEIGSTAFWQCTGLTSITIPDSVTSIGNGAFIGCTGLTSVTIGSGVTSIAESAFYDCTGLTRVDYTGTIAQWCEMSFGNSSSNPLYYAHNLYINNSLITDLVIPSSVTSIGQYVFLCCTGLTSVTIPASVTDIDSYAFSGCTGLTSITFDNPKGWYYKYNGSFRACNLPDPETNADYFTRDSGTPNDSCSWRIL